MWTCYPQLPLFLHPPHLLVLPALNWLTCRRGTKVVAVLVLLLQINPPTHSNHNLSGREIECISYCKHVCHFTHLHYVAAAPVGWHGDAQTNLHLNDTRLNCSPWLAIWKPISKSWLPMTCISEYFWCHVMPPHHTLSLFKRFVVYAAHLFCLNYNKMLSTAASNSNSSMTEVFSTVG